MMLSECNPYGILFLAISDTEKQRKYPDAPNYVPRVAPAQDPPVGPVL